MYDNYTIIKIIMSKLTLKSHFLIDNDDINMKNLYYSVKGIAKRITAFFIITSE